MLSFPSNSGVDLRVPPTSRLEWNRNTRDDFLHGRFSFIAADAEAIGLSRKADAVRQERHSQVVDVIRNTVVSTVNERAVATGPPLNSRTA